MWWSYVRMCSHRKETLMERTLGAPRRGTVIGLVAAAVGIVLLMVAGVDMPVVPPGLVMLAVAAVAAAVSGRRWVAVVAVLVGVAELVGLLASGSATNLFSPGTFLVGTGTWIRLVGTLVAIAAGSIWLVRNRQSATAGNRLGPHHLLRFHTTGTPSLWCSVASTSQRGLCRSTALASVWMPRLIRCSVTLPKPSTRAGGSGSGSPLASAGTNR